MNGQVDEYIARQKSPQKEICVYIRQLIHDTLPDTNEEMKWGVPTFADGKFYIVALKNHVNIGFSINGLTEDEISLFDGGGKTTRHVQVKSLQATDEERITRLLKLVNSKS
ncbi:MAG: DUF1801 domain-containing protein [Dehalococcoidales bacterium]|nr:MAG: DUF1801 domain-containing protein [Dehalococcoidales bacterium]